LNFGLSPDFSVELKFSLSERLSQKLVTHCRANEAAGNVCTYEKGEGYIRGHLPSRQPVSWEESNETCCLTIFNWSNYFL